VKEKESAYDFDIKKTDKIFNLLLEKKQLKLPQIMLFLRLESSKGKSTASFIVPLLIVQMSAEFFDNIFKRLLSRGKSNLSPPRSQQWI
jgi:hypothetical protein